MSLDSPQPKGWYSRGYLPHFDPGEIAQFITIRLADSLPQNLLEQWRQELDRGKIRDVDFRRRIELYLDQGYGSCFLKDQRVARMVQENLIHFDGIKYKLCKSFTAHEANRILDRKGRFWFPEPFDRYIRNHEHFKKTIRYIEGNPVKAGLCEKPSDWRFSSAHLCEDASS
jgi:hypothetical protein